MNRLRADWSRWRSLQQWEQRLLLELLLWRLPLTGLLLQLAGLQRCLAWQTRHGVRDVAQLPQNVDPQDYAQRCAELVTLAARRVPWRSRCLPQALALQAVLQRAGLHPCLRLGVIPATQPLQAHAWIELDGRALGDGGHAGFVAFRQGRLQ